jgi:predicted metalloprotease
MRLERIAIQLEDVLMRLEKCFNRNKKGFISVFERPEKVLVHLKSALSLGKMFLMRF